MDAEGQGWQDIETAPKDGDFVLLSGPGWVDIGNYCDGWLGFRWYGTSVDRDGDRNDCEPTHWMPLPEPVS